MASERRKQEEGFEDPTPHVSLSSRIRVHKVYRRARETQFTVHEPAIRKLRIGLLKAAGKNFVLLQLLFFSLFCYLFGALYKQNSYIHHLNIAFVDYDGGAIGDSVRSAYHSLRKNGFPSLEEIPIEQYPSPSHLRRDVCKAKYWGAIYISPDSSTTVQDVLAGNTTNYNKTAIMQYIWNEARYSTIIDASISSNIQALSSTAKLAYASQNNWADIITNSTENTYTVFADPWTLASDNLQPTAQGARLVYNTLVILLLMNEEFFYLGTLNQLSEMFKIHTRINPFRIIFYRHLISTTFCFIGSLCVTGAIWIFKTGWQVNGVQFVLTWMALWLYTHLNFLTLDVFTLWLPPPFVPMALISWLILNIGSIILPFELMSDFYKWSYVNVLALRLKGLLLTKTNPGNASSPSLCDAS
jgi:hypothetical protein